MCGITGWMDFKKDLTHYPSIIENMTQTLTPRGPDASGTWLTNHCALGHRRLSVMDPENGAQPMVRQFNDVTYTIVYNGEVYNAPELRQELELRGYAFQTHCDTEVVLLAYVEWGHAAPEKLNGIFAFAIWDSKERSLLLVRDRVGVKPLFFSYQHETFLFGSEPKAIIAHPGFPAEVGAEGLAEIFAVGPARTPGHGIYKHMEELRPGTFMIVTPAGISTRTYWELRSEEHEDNVEQTAETIRELLIDIVERQLLSDVPVCTLLSGGLDSSALTSLAAKYYEANQKGILHTYSVDYVDNDKHFKANDFQPNSDAPWIQLMSDVLGTQHHYIHFDTPELVESLEQVVLARDLPGMADIDGSLYLFCKEIKKGATVALSGEAADEVFGGYPWFHREESLNADTFPWALSTPDRIALLSNEFVEWTDPEQYVKDRYQQALQEVPTLKGEEGMKARIREMSYLNITRFMPTLLDRKDRMSMTVGLEVRVPFCDHRLIEYVFNIPWEIKTSGDREKGILRKALKGLLPEEVLTRKKSPYPKTHNPLYTQAVKTQVLNILNDPSSPLLPFINTKQIRELAESDRNEFNLPWFGQLMTGPQMFAYLIQVNYWLKEYKVSIK